MLYLGPGWVVRGTDQISWSLSNHSVRPQIQHWETKIFGQCLLWFSQGPDTSLRDQDILSVPLTTQSGPRYSTERPRYLVSAYNHSVRSQIHHWETKIFAQCLHPLSQVPNTALRDQDIWSVPLNYSARAQIQYWETKIHVFGQSL